MESALRLCGRLFLLTVPIATTSVVVSLPGYAATLASSKSFTKLDWFSSPAFGLVTSTQTDTLAIGSSGSVRAVAVATAELTPQNGFNRSLSRADGSGVGYLGIAESQATVLGTFSVNASQAFSFDFFSRLDLTTDIDNPQLEAAAAFAKIQYNLFDDSTGLLLDSFGLFGELPSSSAASLPIMSLSEYINPTSALIGFSSNGSRSSAFAQLGGTYSRTFNSPVFLRLEESKQNGAAVVAVPAPSLLPGLLISLIALCRKRRRINAAQPITEPVAEREYAVEERS